MTPNLVMKGDTLEMAIKASDIIGVRAVYVHITMAGGETEILRMVGTSVAEYHFDVPRDSPDSLSYIFHAEDMAGNPTETEPKTVTLFNGPPVLVNPPIWSLTEGEEAHLDLRPFIQDPNDALDAITVSCHDPAISVDGFLLTALYEVWTNEYDLQVVLSDGEDEKVSTIRIMMTNVNDPPVISTEISTDVVILEDEELSWTLEARDEDGDDIRWEDDTDLFDIDPASGLIQFTPRQVDVGRHTVTVSAHDGREGMTSVTFDIVVTNVNDAPRILEILPENGTKVKGGEKVKLSVTISDEDGDDVTVTWKHGPDVLGIGSPLKVELKPGENIITVVVDDGTDQVEESFVVIVRKEEDSPGFSLLATLAAVMLVGLMVIRRRWGSCPVLDNE